LETFFFFGQLEKKKKKKAIFEKKKINKIKYFSSSLARLTVESKILSVSGK